MSAFRTKVAIAAHNDILQAKRSRCIADPTKTWWYQQAPWRNPKSWRGSTFVKRMSAKAERKQAKLRILLDR
jgi:hypothetical protein